MILITTAGKVGSEAAGVLVQRDEPVRVLVRDPQKATALRQLGVEVVEGDLDDSASTDAAMHGVKSVVLISPAVPAQELNVIDSAVRASVGHVVKITSKASAESPIARQRGQAEIEAGLIASGLDYTLLRNNFYMQNFLTPASAIAGTSSFGSSAVEAPVGVVDREGERVVVANARRHHIARRGAGICRELDMAALRRRGVPRNRSEGGGAQQCARLRDTCRTLAALSRAGLASALSRMGRGALLSPCDEHLPHAEHSPAPRESAPPRAIACAILPHAAGERFGERRSSRSGCW